MKRRQKHTVSTLKRLEMMHYANLKLIEVGRLLRAAEATRSLAACDTLFKSIDMTLRHAFLRLREDKEAITE